MINYIIEWYRLYPSMLVFIGHKLTHIVAGFVVVFIADIMNWLIIGMVVCLVLAVFKEWMDHYQSYDSTAPRGEEYRYDAPLSAHVLDVIVTMFGGMLALLF